MRRASTPPVASRSRTSRSSSSSPSPPRRRADRAARSTSLRAERKKLDRAILAEALVLLQDPALARSRSSSSGAGVASGHRRDRRPGARVALRQADDHHRLRRATGRGSVRGPAGFPLYDALSRCEGRAPRRSAGTRRRPACTSSWQARTLRDRFADACIALGARRAGSPLRSCRTRRSSRRTIPSRVFRDLERFEPCGHANPAPILEIARGRVLGSRGHERASPGRRGRHAAGARCARSGTTSRSGCPPRGATYGSSGGYGGTTTAAGGRWRCGWRRSLRRRGSCLAKGAVGLASLRSRP
jgi:hypothetical protein